MPGGHYTALSGMQARLGDLDRLASDIANASTAGYKTERTAKLEADRPSFGAELQSAIDVTNGGTRLDRRSGALSPTGRALDLAVDGKGFLVVETAGGSRYTRNGRLSRRSDGVLATADGDAVLGDSGRISVGNGEVKVDADGTVRVAGASVGKLKVVDFAPNAPLVREGASRIRNDGAAPTDVPFPSIASGSLEQSNVSIVERIADLTSVTRNFEMLQRAASVMNDMDTRTITELGRR